jgi:hypothetical protein
MILEGDCVKYPVLGIAELTTVAYHLNIALIGIGRAYCRLQFIFVLEINTLDNTSITTYFVLTLD